jgi:hypothetical protein
MALDISDTAQILEMCDSIVVLRKYLINVIVTEILEIEYLPASHNNS